MSDLGLIRGLITVATLLAFLGICWWAFRPANRERFEKDAQLVFPEEDEGQEKRQGMEQGSGPKDEEVRS